MGAGLVGRCSICGSDILNGQKMYREVVGWASNRTQGGINHLIGRQLTGRVAHNACAEGEKYDKNQITIEEFLT